MTLTNQALDQSAKQPKEKKFSVFLVNDEPTKRNCFKLRYDIFANEMGANLPFDLDSLNQDGLNQGGLDQDRFDAHSQHLAVFDNNTNEIVATTRLLSTADSQHTNGFYSETEFDLSNIITKPFQFTEVGRTCIHPDYRCSSALPMLWQGIARYIVENKIDYLFGCASIPFSNGDKYLRSVMHHLRARHFSSPEFRVHPHIPVRLEEMTPHADDAILPTLLKAYLRQGAVICGEPYWDAAFGVADVFVLLNCKQITDKYLNHFINRI